MPTAIELLRENKTRELWLKCCGFIELSLEQFMTIQRQLLQEQLEQLKDCEMGQKVMQGATPRNVREFREQVPITTYADYHPYLLEQVEDALPEKPLLWQRTSGRTSEYSFKWVPVTARMYRELGDLFMALLMFASCPEKGAVALREHDKFLYALAPPPYASGCWAHRVDEEGIFDFLPSVERAESMPFQERIEEGFRMGLSAGIDVMAAISTILVTVGERFGQGGSLQRISSVLAQPQLIPRLLTAVVKSKLARRVMLPRDIWSLKGLVSSGMDSAVYRERIKEMWGRYPLDIYGATESVIIAMQTWDYTDMTFVPNLNFLEFMPPDEYDKWSQDRSYQPQTRLLDEVVAGEKYVVVITNFLGGAFVRYVFDDIIRITALRNQRLNINIPQMTFYSRAGSVIDFAGASFTEKSIWQAIEDSGLDYGEWAVRKEIDPSPVLHVYIELKGGGHHSAEVAAAIGGHLKKLQDDYVYLVDEQDIQLLQVSLLLPGAFQRYREKREADGADIAHLKPPRINPPDEVLAVLQGTAS